MKIVVLNGSPKGNVSVTMQYVNYIQNNFKEHEFVIINISQKINQIVNNRETFENIISQIESSDGIIWAFPLYVFTVHSNYLKFIELIFDRKVEYAFKGKYTSIIATSIHFYDHTAINYINSICDDLNMNYVDYFSLHMYDLKKKDIRNNLLKFTENYFDAIKNQVVTLKNHSPIKFTPINYVPKVTYNKIPVSDKKIVLVTDSLESSNLNNMIDKFNDSFSQAIELINLQDIDIKGSCLGCLKCAYNYECAYTGKDGFIDFYNNKLKTADIIVFAGTVKYRHLSSTWKTFFDRGFFYTHTPSLSGKQIGFLVSGPLSQIPNLKQILRAYTEWQGSNLVGFLTDEYDTSIEIDKQIYAFSHNLVKLSTMNYSKPATFLGVAGMKIFRDEIWGTLRFPFVADHKAFKTLKLYDFPQKNYKSRIGNSILMLMTKFTSIRKEIYSNRIKTAMIQSLKEFSSDPSLNE